MKLLNRISTESAISGNSIIDGKKKLRPQNGHDGKKDLWSRLKNLSKSKRNLESKGGDRLNATAPLLKILKHFI